MRMPTLDVIFATVVGLLAGVVAVGALVFVPGVVVVRDPAHTGCPL
jgi:hypothetical protein